MRKSFALTLILTAVALTCLCLALRGGNTAEAAAAATFTVNSLADTPDALPTDGLCADASGACTLRAAIQQANVNPSSDTIGFSVNGTINLTGALPDIFTDIGIEGPGANNLTVRRDTGGDYRIFTVGVGATASISGLTVRDGRVPPVPVSQAGLGGGGGIANDGSLALADCVVSENSTADASPAAGPFPAGGGGIANRGTLTLTNCTVRNNATGKGGVVLTDGTAGGSGGGIWNSGTLNMTGSAVADNTTGDGGAGVIFGGSGGAGAGLYSGGPAGTAMATVTNSVFSGNRTGKGGAVSADDPNAQAGFGGHGGGIYNDGPLMTLTRSSANGNFTGQGASLQNGLRGTAGSGGSGAGAYNAAGRTLTAVNSVFSANLTGAGGQGGGQQISQGNGGDGAGVSNAGTLRLSHCTVVSNQTGLAGDGGGRDGVGGGLHGGGTLRSTIVALNLVRFPRSLRDLSGGGFTSAGYNFFGSGSVGISTDRVSDNPGLDLATLVPLGNSLVLDAGLARDIDDQPVTDDRRGAPRPVDFPAVPPQTGGDNSDIGAFERQTTDPTPTPTPTTTTVQFSTSAAEVTEGCVEMPVTITRTGPKDGTTEATYSISRFVSNHGSPRGDFTGAVGRVTFAPGEDSKTVSALISEDAYAEGDEFFIVFIINVTGGSGGSPLLLVVTIKDNETADGTANPIDNPSTFVCQHYHDFLNRHGDPAGQAFWTDQLASCGGDAACLAEKRENVSAAFFLSLEFQQTGYYAIRTHKAAFGNQPGTPRYSSFIRDLGDLGRGVVVGQPGFEARLEANKQAYAEQFVNRTDFLTAHGGQTAEQYVDSLFAGAGATPTAGERQAAVDAFGAGDTAGRANSLRKVVESGSVYNRLYNPAFVLMQYFGYLRRNPNDAPNTDFSGYDFWLTKMNSFSLPGEDVRDPNVALARVRRAQMVKAFIESGEYRGRFFGDASRGEQFGDIASLWRPADRRRDLARALTYALLPGLDPRRGGG